MSSFDARSSIYPGYVQAAEPVLGSPSGLDQDLHVLALVQLCHHWSPSRASRISLSLVQLYVAYTTRQDWWRYGGLPAVVSGIGADSERATYAPSLTQMDYLGVVGGEGGPPKGVDLD